MMRVLTVLATAFILVPALPGGSVAARVSLQAVEIVVSETIGVAEAVVAPVAIVVGEGVGVAEAPWWRQSPSSWARPSRLPKPW